MYLISLYKTSRSGTLVKVTDVSVTEGGFNSSIDPVIYTNLQDVAFSVYSIDQADGTLQWLVDPDLVVDLPLTFVR